MGYICPARTAALMQGPSRYEVDERRWGVGDSRQPESHTRSADRLEATADHPRPAAIPGSVPIDRVFPAASAAWPHLAKAAQQRDLSVEQQPRRAKK
jgi:hypothetical protein